MLHECASPRAEVSENKRSRAAMIVFWGLVVGLPMAAFGALCAVKPSKALAFSRAFEQSRIAAIVLTVAAWFWTAHELDIIGIDVFDAVTKRFPGELWILALVLSYLTVIWMPKNLPVRALCGILMLAPASLFRVTRLLLPESGASPVHIFVVWGYCAAIAGMYGMFYPWRLEKGLELVVNAPRALVAAFGAFLAVFGIALAAAGFTL